MTDYPTPEGERIITTAPMSLERAREHLTEAGFTMRDDGAIQHREFGDFDSKGGICWMPGFKEAGLEFDLTADQLEALAVWMRAHAKEGG